MEQTGVGLVILNLNKSQLGTPHCACAQAQERHRSTKDMEGAKELRITVVADPSCVSMSQKELQRSVFDVVGICCPSEACLVDRILKPLAGVADVSVNVAAKTVTVLHDPISISSSAIARALNQARLDASIRVYGELRITQKWPRPYTIASGILVLISFGAFWFPPLEWTALCAVAAGLPPVLIKGFTALRNCIVDVNILMLIAVAGSVCLGDYQEAGSIVFLFTLAEWLESRSTEQAREALTSVTKLAPLTAVVEGSNDKVAVEKVGIGTLLAVKAGDTVPIDGVVVAGKSSVDESSLTGESVPVHKVVGSCVWAGTHTVSGYMSVKTTAMASESTVARMARLVEEAQSQRSRTDQFIQRFAKYYTPGVILVAAGMAVEAAINEQRRRYWLYLALQFMVIACPCALVISTPVATACAIARAASMGVLIKASHFLETLAQLKAIAFDKTGTLTEGEFRVTDAQFLDFSIDPVTLLHWLMSVESKSSHPMSAAIVAYARQKGISGPPAQVRDFDTWSGEGVSASISGVTMFVGNSRMMGRLGCNIPASASAASTYVAVGGKLLMAITLADSLRHEAAEALQNLTRMGMKVAMLTGDNAAAAATVQAEIESTSTSTAAAAMVKVVAGATAEEKVKAVGDLRTEVGPTAMVGDGINDAPALAAADVGFAMAVAGSSVAMETADVALISSDLRRIAETVQLGRQCVWTIRANVAASVVMKAVMVGLALAGYASLWLAVLADVGACLIVTANSMMLLRPRQGQRQRQEETEEEEEEEEPYIPLLLPLQGQCCGTCKQAAPSPSPSPSPLLVD